MVAIVIEIIDFNPLIEFNPLAVRLCFNPFWLLGYGTVPDSLQMELTLLISPS